MSEKRVPLWEGPVPGALGEAEEDRPTLVPHLAEGAQKRAAVIVCPGGGYARRAEHEGEPVARWLNSIGLHAFVLHYRVAPYRHPYPLMDAQQALQLVRQRADEWRVDASHVGILGFSAGGHLAATAATHFDTAGPDCRPDFAILCYPVITFGEVSAHVGSIRNLLGPQPSEQLRQELSNELHVNEDTPPTFLWHTANDAGVPVENSLLFASALSRHGVASWQMHIFPDGRHGLGLAQGHPEVGVWTELCATWLTDICSMAD
jgi:acetyl esterase/lipase